MEITLRGLEGATISTNFPSNMLKHGCARLEIGRHTRCSVWFGLATIVVTRCSVITLEPKTG